MTFDEFSKTDLRAGKVLQAERVRGSDKLIKMQLDLGEKDAAGSPVGRQIVAGIGKAYEPEALVGRTIIVVANLDPRNFKIKIPSADGGTETLELQSNGMLLAAHAADDSPVILGVEKEVPPGSKIS